MRIVKYNVSSVGPSSERATKGQQRRAFLSDEGPMLETLQPLWIHLILAIECQVIWLHWKTRVWVEVYQQRRAFLSDEGPTLDTLDFTIRIGSTPTFLYFDSYLYSAYAAHYIYLPTHVYSSIWRPPHRSVTTKGVAHHFVEIFRSSSIWTIVIFVQTHINPGTFTMRLIKAKWNAGLKLGLSYTLLSNYVRVFLPATPNMYILKWFRFIIAKIFNILRYVIPRTLRHMCNLHIKETEITQLGPKDSAKFYINM